MQGMKRDYNGKIKNNSLSLEDQVLYTTIPLWKIPYEEQIKQKTQTARKYIAKLCNLILTRNPNLDGWIQRQKEENKGFLCKVDPMVRTCNPNGYKAKCEFRVGFDEVSNERVVGFKCAKSGVLSVCPGDRMIQLPHQMKLVVKLFEDYIKQSPLPPYVVETKSGFWHHLIVRVSMAGEVMLLIDMNSKNLTLQQLQYVKSDLSNFFFNGDGRVANVQSLYYHPHIEGQTDQVPSALELLGGMQRLIEPVMGTNFHIGPFTHFLTNACSAQTFYQAISDLVQPGPNVTIIDICAGIGAIGLTLAKKCKEVYAIEMLEQHIADGVLTAQMNNITNFSFLHGIAEEQLGDLLKTLEGRNKEIVCILDPPKLGAHKRIVDQVRMSPSVKRFVYVCNNHKSPVRLFLDFCASPLERGTYNFTGLPFVPVRIIPIDLAPHTPHSQLLVLFERCSSSTSRKSKELKPRKQPELEEFVVYTQC
ncbi:HpaII tiny fragments locus 9c protein, putative [Pediculus humanus corporis]|uniref:tRNA (uracil(54)-C(5))-methyltransferase n=1 Tax=Pediculus humanus subsp. corporis TaxID=121224 RepID=E0VTS5_PEDHC|nr:HpaII tiny fragments locus 9c protein, putative [Pediculus humanus corporis]EEB16781.1 HpaII tiny fragments locus 9c protein, putative [Pediculus humanus corporis]